ncbi:unnamed protein product, partial [Closterium sp. NIES-53]
MLSLLPCASASAAPGTGESALYGTAPTEALHTFTLDSGALRSFRDSTTLTPLSRPIAVSLADPSRGPVLAHSSTVLPCPAALSGLLSGLHLPSFSMNLRVTHCTCSRTGRHLATFTRRPGSSLYSLTTASAPATASGQVAASSQVCAAVSRSSPVSAPCSCRPLSHENLLWHHRLGHPSLPRLRGMASRTLVSGLPRSLPPLPPGPAPTCVPCVEGRQRAAPHSSTFPPTEAPLQTLHMDVWGPARVGRQGHERYFLLIVDEYSRYTTVFSLRSKGEVTEVLIDWIRDRGGEFLRPNQHSMSLQDRLLRHSREGGKMPLSCSIMGSFVHRQARETEGADRGGEEEKVGGDAGAGGDGKGGKCGLVQKERREEGMVSPGVYVGYARRVGVWQSLLLFLLLAFGQTLACASDCSVRIYTALVLTGVTVSFLRAALSFHWCVRAASCVHAAMLARLLAAMLARVLASPLAFFHPNPMGCILNRFSADQGILNDLLPFTLFNYLHILSLAVGAIAMVALGMPWILVPMALLCLLFLRLRHIFLCTSREAKRLEVVTCSPVYAHYATTIHVGHTQPCVCALWRHHPGVFCMVGEEQREEESEQGRGEEQVEEQVPAGWPSKGAVRVEGLTVRYRPTLDPVLQDVSFQLRRGEKCGVVGRTGEHCSSCQLAIDGSVC